MATKKTVKKTVPKLTGKARQLANLKPFKKGQSGNPKGHPKGQRNFATIYREALKAIAKEKKTTPEKLEDLILKVGIAKAIGGDYRFWQDLHDRIHDKPKQRTELTGADGEPLIPGRDAVDSTDAVIDKFLNVSGSKTNSKRGKS